MSLIVILAIQQSTPDVVPTDQALSATNTTSSDGASTASATGRSFLFVHGEL